jgi:hypothetical protein
LLVRIQTGRRRDIRESASTSWTGFPLSLTNAALSAFFGAVLAILAILAGMAGVGTCAGRCGNIEWNLIEKENRYHDLSQNSEQS